MISDDHHNFWQDKRNIDDDLKQYKEQPVERHVPLNFDHFNYESSKLEAKPDIAKSSKYHKFLSELAKGSFLKTNNLTAETSQLFEGVVRQRISGGDAQLSYSQIFAVKNISGTFIMNRNNKGPQIDLANRFLEEANYWNASKENNFYHKMLEQHVRSKNVEHYLLNNEPNTFKTKETFEFAPKLHNFRNQLYKSALVSKKPAKSIQKHINNCYECIRKISEDFDDILKCGPNFTERSTIAKSTVTKKSRFDHYDRGSTVSDSNESTSITGRFLNTTHANNGSKNEIIFKNRSEILRKDISIEEINDYSYCFKADKHCNLKNRYTSLVNSKDQKRITKTREEHNVPQTLDITWDPDIKEEEYLEWLKRNNLLSYTSYCKSHNSDIARSMISECPQKLLRYQKEDPLRYPSLMSFDIPPFRYESEEDVKENKFMEIQFYNMYEMIIYEHLVVINFLTFFTSYFSARRIRKLSLNDHIVRIVFFAICYGVFMFVKNSEIALMIN